jgi:hypothetical protein
MAAVTCSLPGWSCFMLPDGDSMAAGVLGCFLPMARL